MVTKTKYQEFSNILYEDKYCKLKKSTLELKLYYFPFGNKTIQTNDIQRVFYKKQEFRSDLFKSKDWGMSLTLIWWGCDIGRSFRGCKPNEYYNVVIDSGSKIMAGFTVVEFNEFSYHLKQLIGESRFIPNVIPNRPVIQLFGD